MRSRTGFSGVFLSHSIMYLITESAVVLRALSYKDREHTVKEGKCMYVGEEEGKVATSGRKGCNPRLKGACGRIGGPPFRPQHGSSTQRTTLPALYEAEAKLHTIPQTTSESDNNAETQELLLLLLLLFFMLLVCLATRYGRCT